ncbi:MAG: orotidine-5'-phosphate decarboxylase [Gammaproteobacteria bacterium]|nr:orotidine-5'-phosphate decarboxylase [Gammaproteobacteria bacterium]
MTNSTANDSKIIVALDFEQEADALALVDRLEPSRCRLKVGKEMFTRNGPKLIEKLVAKNYDVFLDLKFHDIPNTVAGACRSAAELGVWMINVHALGGKRMMAAAREALEQGSNKPLLIGVTILTSMGEADLVQIGLSGTPADNVSRLALLAEEAGLDGVVCSPKEVALLRETVKADFKLVTPGIRPAWAEKGDQTRITTPADALRLGSDYLVIGRPITRADDPLEALAKIEDELAN